MPVTKNVCFPNLMIVLENFYVEQMIIDGFLHFCIFKTNSIFKTVTQIHDSDLHLCSKA